MANITKAHQKAADDFLKNMVSGGKQVAKYTIPVLAVPMLGALISYYMNRKSEKADKAALQGSLKTVFEQNPNLAKNPTQTMARFQELSYIAPVVAKNPQMAGKFIESRLDKGLSIDDIHKLSVIQHSGFGGQREVPASQKAIITGADLTKQVVGVLGYQGIKDFSAGIHGGLNQMRVASDKFKKDMQEADEKAKESMKKQSSPQQKLSDECLGIMLSDRYLIMREGLCKEAAKKPGVSSIFTGGAKQLTKGISFMAPVMILGGIAQGTMAIADALQKKKLHAQADSAFKKIQKDSEIIQGNPELSIEALDAIKTFAPSMAAKPAVLKSFVENVARVGMLPHPTINELAVAETNIGKAKGAGFSNGFLGGLAPSIKDFMGKDTREAIRYSEGP